MKRDFEASGDHPPAFRNGCTFHQRRLYKYLVFIIFLVMYIVCNMKEESLTYSRSLSNQIEDDNRNFNKNMHLSRRNQETKFTSESGEVDFRSGSNVKHISQATIFLSEVEARAPDALEIMHFESTLFFGLNEAMINSNINIQINDIVTTSVEILLDEESYSNSNTIESNGIDGEEMEGDDGGTEGDDGGTENYHDETEESDDSKWEDDGNWIRRNTQNEITTSIQTQKSKRSIEVSNKYKLQLEVRITSTQYLSSRGLKIESLILEAIDQNIEVFIRHLQGGKELDPEQAVARLYYQSVDQLFCTKVIDARPDVENRSEATALPPRPQTPEPTPMESIPVRGKVQGRIPIVEVGIPNKEGSTKVTSIDDEKISTEDDASKPNLEPRSIMIVSPRAKYLRNVSACVFVVTLIVIGFYNMVRLNRRQVERRRKKVQLAKVAYQAPLNMTSGLMDVGVGDGVGSSASATIDKTITNL